MDHWLAVVLAWFVRQVLRIGFVHVGIGRAVRWSSGNPGGSLEGGQHVLQRTIFVLLEDDIVQAVLIHREIGLARPRPAQGGAGCRVAG